MRFILRLLSKRLIVNSKLSTGLSSKRFSFFKDIAYKVGTQFLVDKKFPVQVGLELSRACNFDCPFCSRLDAPSGNHMDLSVAKKVIDEAAKHGPTVFTSHMWGEPLLNPKWPEFYRYIKGKSRFNGISLTTNGYLLTEEVSRKLIDLNVDEVVISLHTFNESEYHVRIGKNIDIGIIFSNIFKLLELKKCLKSNIKVVVKVFERDINIFENEKCIEFIKQGAYVENDFYDNSGGSTNEWSEVKNNKEERYPCFHPWLTCTVNFKGEVSICCVDNKMDLKIGDVTRDSFENIWSSPKVIIARKEHLGETEFDFCKICEGCDSWKNKPNFFFKSQYKIHNNYK